MCSCTSCSYTDSFHAKGFDAWPRGNPAGRKAASEYAAHVKHSKQWGAHVDENGKATPRIPEFPGGAPTSPLRYSTPPQRDGGAHRSYPKHPDTPEGWTTAAYVEAFIAANGYAKWKEASPTDAEPARPAAPCKAPRHFPARDRPRETARIYAMPKAKTEKRPVGRPALDGRRVVIKLEETQIKQAAKLGEGNVAAGIREALRRAQSG